MNNRLKTVLLDLMISTLRAFKDGSDNEEKMRDTYNALADNYTRKIMNVFAKEKSV